MSNKFKPFWSKQLNVEFIKENFTKKSLERSLRPRGVEVDKRKSLARIIEENYDILAWDYSSSLSVDWHRTC